MPACLRQPSSLFKNSHKALLPDLVLAFAVEAGLVCSHIGAWLHIVLPFTRLNYLTAVRRHNFDFVAIILCSPGGGVTSGKL